MDLALTQDQAMLAETLEKWASHHQEIPPELRTAPFLPGDALADELANQGYYAVAAEPDLGPIGALLLIEAVGKTPWAVEVAASALVAPMVGIDEMPRPLALMRFGGAPLARFLRPGGSALVDAGDHVRLLPCDERVQTVESRYAYPFGRYSQSLEDISTRVPDVDIDQFRGWRRVATCAEALAAMQAALDLTVNFVGSRVQFGKPIGSFQAVQHRLAECSAMLHGARLMVYRAALERASSAHLAAIVTHDAVKRVLYETTQFHGAIGLTLEYPLHLWSYRLRILQFELAEVLDITGVEHTKAVVV